MKHAHPCLEGRVPSGQTLRMPFFGGVRMVSLPRPAQGTRASAWKTALVLARGVSRALASPRLKCQVHNPTPAWPLVNAVTKPVAARAGIGDLRCAMSISVVCLEISAGKVVYRPVAAVSTLHSVGHAAEAELAQRLIALLAFLFAHPLPVLLVSLHGQEQL